MRYIDVNWLHDLDDEPYRLVSEINPDGFEVRKLEFFQTGEIGLATDNFNTRNTRLGITKIPTLEEINSQEEFQGKAINKQEFDSLWRQYAKEKNQIDKNI